MPGLPQPLLRSWSLCPRCCRAYTDQGCGCPAAQPEKGEGAAPLLPPSGPAGPARGAAPGATGAARGRRLRYLLGGVSLLGVAGWIGAALGLW